MDEKQVVPFQVPSEVPVDLKCYEFYLTPAGQVYYTNEKPIVTVKTKDKHDYSISLVKLKDLAPYFYNLYNDLNEFEPEDSAKIIIPVCKDTFMLLTYINFVVKELKVEVDQLNVWADFGETFKSKNVLKELDAIEANDTGKYIKNCFSQLFPGEFEAYCKTLKSQSAKDSDKIEAFKNLYLSLVKLPKERERKEFLSSLERRKIDTHYFKIPSNEKLAVTNVKNDLAPLLVPVLGKRFLSPTHIIITTQISELDPEFTTEVFPAGNNNYFTSIGNYKFSINNPNNSYSNLNQRNQILVIKVLGLLNLLGEMDLKPTIGTGYSFNISGLLADRYL